jgi:hypothetical protein
VEKSFFQTMEMLLELGCSHGCFNGRSFSEKGFKY